TVVLLGTYAMPETASAMLVVSKSKKSAGDGVTVVAVREGHDAILSIGARVLGPAADVALLIPVRAGYSDVKTLPANAADPINRLAAPRVAEFWEADPCELHPDTPTADDATPGAPGAPSPDAPQRPVIEGAASKAEVLDKKNGADMVSALKHD